MPNTGKKWSTASKIPFQALPADISFFVLRSTQSAITRTA